MNKKTYFYGVITGFLIFVFIFMVGLGIKTIKDTIPRVLGIAQEEEYENINDKIKQINALLDAKYIEEFEMEELIENALEGYVKGVGDPYTSYFSKEKFQAFMEDSAGSYEGIGVVVTFGENGEDIVVLSPYEGSPGEKAGIKQGDHILRVDGTDISGMSLEEAVKLIKGPKDTEVVLTVYRRIDDKLIDITITRDVISMETVSHEMLEGDIGYMSISGFQEVTYDQFLEAYKDLENQGQKGMIIDLRNNPGGLVNIVSKIGDELLGEGLIVYTEDKDGNREEVFSDEKHQFKKPLVILVNEYSASASEILAGAAKDHKAATIVGTTTFGKGLVQGSYQLNDGSAIKVTIAKYFTPSGNYIHGVGIEPNIEVELPEELKNQFKIDRDKDTQLAKAIEVIKDML